MKLHQRLLLLYEVGDTGYQLAYSSGNQKLLAVKGSTRVHAAAHGENGKSVTAVACMNASGSNWIPSDSEIGKLENEIV
jgi:hypothetical protein